MDAQRPQRQRQDRNEEGPPKKETVALKQKARTEPQSEKQANETAKHRKPLFRRHPYLIALGALALLAGAGAGVVWWLKARRFETTQDAHIEARPYAVNSKIAGYLVAVPVTDNEKVARGAVLARVDDRDYRIAFREANAAVAQAKASVSNIEAQIVVQQDQIDSAEAKVHQARASVQFARQQESRAQRLLHSGAGTLQQAQQSQTTLRQDEAELHQALDSLSAAQKRIAPLEAQKRSAEASVAEQQAARDKAALNLSYTTIKAAEAGTVVKLSAARGEYVQPGTALMMFIPKGLWVIANFKETQIGDIRPGQPVEIHVDAYPGEVLHGRVVSIQPGSNIPYSLLPSENATGNFVKVVQRVPVKIKLGPIPPNMVLGPGLSVEPYVRVR